jgi:hypothetical protein
LSWPANSLLLILFDEPARQSRRRREVYKKIMNEPAQVKDSPELLDMMIADMATVPAAFRPTNYWKVYEEFFLPELQSLGLRDFRRRQGSVLSSFGATDLKPTVACLDLNKSRLFNNRFSKRLPGWR